VQFVQGYLADPATGPGATDWRPICAGIVPTGADSLWPGVAIQEFLQQPFGSALALAESVAQITGFTVADDSAGLIVNDPTQVPQALPGMAINFVRLGSRARLIVQCSQALANAVNGATVGANAITWDLDAQQLIQGTPALPVLIVGAVAQGARVIVEGWSGNLKWSSSGAAAVIIV